MKSIDGCPVCYLPVVRHEATQARDCLRRARDKLEAPRGQSDAPVVKQPDYADDDEWMDNLMGWCQ
jgi:hypothetical protein